MTSLTVRLQDEKYNRLKAVAHRRGTSVNRLFDEMATVILAESDSETRFKSRSERGHGKTGRGLELLEKAMGNEGK